MLKQPAAAAVAIRMLILTDVLTHTESRLLRKLFKFRKKNETDLDDIALVLLEIP
jgi:hypothetical protein